MELTNAPWGYDSWTHTEVTPKPPPITWHWRIGPVTTRNPHHHRFFEQQSVTIPFQPSEVTMQLTADQQVELSISGEDRYGNQVDLSGDVVWLSSDESIVQVTNQSSTSATAVAAGPA